LPDQATSPSTFGSSASAGTIPANQSGGDLLAAVLRAVNDNQEKAAQRGN